MTGSLFYDVPEVQGRIVVLRRTSTRFETPAEAAREAARLGAELDVLGRKGRRLLLDVRAVAPNAEERFEAPLAALRSQTRRDFERIAVLLRTKVGLLQANRILSDDKDTESRLFDDEEAARAFLTSD